MTGSAPAVKMSVFRFSYRTYKTQTEPRPFWLRLSLSIAAEALCVLPHMDIEMMQRKYCDQVSLRLRSHAAELRKLTVPMAK